LRRGSGRCSTSNTSINHYQLQIHAWVRETIQNVILLQVHAQHSELRRAWRRSRQPLRSRETAAREEEQVVGGMKMTCGVMMI
jgi:hypothetical protein